MASTRKKTGTSRKKAAARKTTGKKTSARKSPARKATAGKKRAGEPKDKPKRPVKTYRGRRAARTRRA